MQRLIAHDERGTLRNSLKVGNEKWNGGTSAVLVFWIC